jgi:hypothetical protein
VVLDDPVKLRCGRCRSHKRVERLLEGLEAQLPLLEEDIAQHQAEYRDWHCM